MMSMPAKHAPAPGAKKSHECAMFHVHAGAPSAPKLKRGATKATIPPHAPNKRVSNPGHLDTHSIRGRLPGG